MSDRTLTSIEKKELERLEKLKDLYIDEMMGKTALLNEQMKEVRSGSWLTRLKQYAKEIKDEI